MKPLFMRLKAFGPFPDTVDVSFDRVFDGGLFLIHGRTGAGKTSLLDGLCFSLFGRPSSEEREKDLRGLRSDLANSDTMTETELVFAIGSVVYRVHRVPTQPTPKKRGEGFTEHKGSAEVYRLEDSIEAVREILQSTPKDPDFSKLSWAPLAGKVEAVDTVIENLLGMNERQFRQVVVLPQGKFREFLSSTSTERQVILEKLFQTDRFSRLQLFIATRARAGETAYREASQGLQTKLESFGLAGFDEIPVRKLELTEKSTNANSKLKAARLSSEQLSQELNQAKELERSRDRLQALKRESETLSARQGEMTAMKRRAAVSRLWIPIFTLEDQLIILKKKSTDIQTKREQSGRSITSLQASLQKATTEHTALIEMKPSIDEMTAERSRLRELVPLLQDIERASRQIAVDEAKNAKSREDMKAFASDLTKLECEQAALVTSLFAIDEFESSQESKRVGLEDRRIKEMELGFHHSEASRLAAVLSPGAPCPVCGSVDHPKPARGESKVVAAGDTPLTAEFIAREKKTFEKLQSELTEKRARRQTRLEPLVAILQKTPVQKSTVQRSADGDASISSTDFAKTFERFEQTAKSIVLIRQNQDALEVEFKTRADAIEISRQSTDLKRNSVPEAERSLETVMKRGLFLKTEQETREPEIRRLEKQQIQTGSDLALLNGTALALDDELKRVNAEIAIDSERLDKLRRETEVAIATETNQPFAPPARSIEAEIKVLETEVEKYSEQMTKTAAALTEVEKSLQHTKVVRPSVQVQSEFEAASKSRTELEQMTARLQIEIENLAKLESETKTGTEKLAGLKEAAERAARMSALLTGDRSQNKMLVPLSRFVLQNRFEEVLEQANRRLTRMSRGQFQLRRPALSRNLRDSQGLELSVEDSVAGKERHAGSLSGGESFMAALSLALGLADVVQADLGGVRLDSVLIDEGFGTLDSESLDLAMKTLIDLQAGGRMVGIISHVQELKSQVQEQLEVVKSATGSQVVWKN